MRITSVDAIPVALKYKKPYRSSLGIETEAKKVLVRISTDAGFEGIAEATTWPAFGGGTADFIKEAISMYTPVLIGADPFDHELLMTKLRSIVAGETQGLAAVDVALWDLKGKAAGVPLYAMAGGRFRSAIQVQGAVPAGLSAEETARAALEQVEKGFTIIKMKVGAEPFRADLERIRAVSEVIEGRALLRVDVNGAWNESESVGYIRAMEGYAVESVEQPLPAWNIEGAARLRRKIGLPLIADESLWSLQDAYRIISANAADILSVKVCKAGGFTQAKKVMAVAEAAGIPCLVGTMAESDLGICAGLHLVASSPVASYANGLAAFQGFERSLLTESTQLKVANGYIEVPDKPGLGVEIDPNILGGEAK